jgi:hypothetical protein
MKGKAQYTWPPSANLFWSATFDDANIIDFFTKIVSYPSEEVNCTEASPSVGVPWSLSRFNRMEQITLKNVNNCWNA